MLLRRGKRTQRRESAKKRFHFAPSRLYVRQMPEYRFYEFTDAGRCHFEYIRNHLYYENYRNASRRTGKGKYCQKRITQ